MPALSAPAPAPAAVTLSYTEYFSGVGAGWGPATSAAFVAALESTFASAGATAAAVAPVDFPVAMGVTLHGVSLAAFNSVPHLQDQVQDAIGTDAGVNGTSQVTLGSFLSNLPGDNAGLYLPFTVDNLGADPAAAATVISKLFTSGELVTTSSALSTTLATAGISCALSYAPPMALPAGLPATPSTGAILAISISLPNVTAATTAVGVNMMDDGMLQQQLTADGVTLGPLLGGAVVETQSVSFTGPAGAPVAVPVPPVQRVFLAPTAASGAAGARSALALVGALAVAAAAALL